MTGAPTGSKKHRERMVLDHLLAFGVIGGAVIHESETPDFVLDFEGRRIGVEVTQYIRGRSDTGSAQREQHAFIQRVLEHARSILQQQNREPLYVSIDALNGRTVSDVTQVATELAESVGRCLDGEHIPPRPLPFGLDLPQDPPFYECAVPPLMVPIANRITVVRLPKGSYTHWHIRQSGDTKAYVTELEALIASKERHLERYPPDCGEVWLVVDAFGGDILQAITPTREVVSHCYLTRFARVFLVDTTETTILQLWTERPGQEH